MSKRRLRAAFSSIAAAAVVLPAFAADVTPQRLMDAAGDPQNWLMVHHDYDNSRHSPLHEINRDTARDLKLKFMFSTGGRATGGTQRGKEESTPLVDDGFMYVIDTWSRVMKFDVRSGTQAIPLWRYDPKITRARTTRGLAMYAIFCSAKSFFNQSGPKLTRKRCAVDMPCPGRRGSSHTILPANSGRKRSS